MTARDVIAARPPEPTPHPAVRAGDANVSADEDAASVDADKLAERLDNAMSDSGIGDGLFAYVADAKTHDQLFALREGKGAVPASTTKIVTAVSVLHAVGADARIETAVAQGGAPDEIVLVGGGDPALTEEVDPQRYPEMATLEKLAHETAASLREEGIDEVRLSYDDSLYPGSDMGPGWKQGYVDGGSVAPVHALMIDGGRVYPEKHYSERVPDPPMSAAEAFAEQLGEAGVEVEGAPSEAAAPEDAEKLAGVMSAPVSALVEKMLMESDNNIAEALLRQVAIAQGEPPSFEGASAAVSEVMAELGVSGVHVEDGSGLSVNNLITPKALVELLTVAAEPDRPNVHTLLSGLPVANFTGTLTNRYSPQSPATEGAGLIRAKTGTLSGVSTLAGYAYNPQGRLLVFAFMANDAYGAAGNLDQFATTIATCACS